ncbi:Fc.00g039760.m01.CDS01 [Cosmosporella sp. VM-42]
MSYQSSHHQNRSEDPCGEATPLGRRNKFATRQAGSFGSGFSSEMQFDPIPLMEVSHQPMPKGFGGGSTVSMSSFNEAEFLRTPSHEPPIGNESTSTLLPRNPFLTSGRARGGLNKKGLKKPFSKEHSWLLEIAALLTSIAAFGCVLYLLLYYNERPLSEWKSSTLSLNTVVSVLSVISRATLGFIVSACIAQCKWNWFGKRQEQLITFDRLDDASRGPGGSARLLWSMKTRPHWIILGAIATIILLGYGPFFQAVIAFDEKLLVYEGTNSSQAQSRLSTRNNNATKDSSSGGSIGRCSMLDAGSYKESIKSSQGFANLKLPNGTEFKFTTYAGFDTRVDLGMSASVWNGFSPLVSAQNLWPSFSCGSGNCSWDAFASLAICSSCQDISHHLRKFSGVTTIPESSNFGWEDGSTPPKISNNNYEASGLFSGLAPGRQHYTKYDIPNLGLNLSNYNGKKICDPNDSGCPDTYISAKIETNPGRTFSFSDLRTMILALQVIEADVSWENNKTTWEDTPVTARECSLYFCVNAYESKIESGRVIENVVGSWTNRTPGSYYGKNENMELFQIYTNYTLDELQFTRTDLQLYIPSDEEPKFSSLQGDTFNVTQASIASLLKLLTEDLTYAGDNYDPDTLYMYPSLGGPNPPGFMLGIGETHDVVKTFENAALSLTKWMRDRSLQESPLLGKMMQVIIIIRVQWVYLIWPITSLVLGSIFAVLSIWETKRMNLPAWKDSALATLAYGAGGEITEKLREGKGTQRLSDKAKELTVRLEYPGEQAGLVLVKQD